jgi:AraC-like DNA-binding protein
MFDNWDDIVITKIALAIFIPPKSGATVHNNRPFHGLVLNGDGKRTDYVFSDGTVLKTYENTLSYLPKGSYYKVLKSLDGEGCWAINFDLISDIKAAPFSVKIQNYDSFLNSFKKSAEAFSKSDGNGNLKIMRNLYDIILSLKKECDREYVSGKKLSIINPALEIMNREYRSPELSIEKLACVCGISIAYFRRIFTEKFGMSPKEYIINRRMDYAKKLLLSGQLSISEVSQMCGYDEPSEFSREFSKREGISPSSYKKNAR